MLLSEPGFLMKRPLWIKVGDRRAKALVVAVTQGFYNTHTTTNLQALPFAALTDESASHVSRSMSIMLKATRWVVSTTLVAMTTLLQDTTVEPTHPLEPRAPLAFPNYPAQCQHTRVCLRWGAVPLIAPVHPRASIHPAA